MIDSKNKMLTYTQLETMRERTPRGGRHWAAPSVENLLGQAARLGLAPAVLDNAG